MERSTILLVDDNPQILGILTDLLRPLGYQLMRANSGAEALELATAHPPDLVLLDVMMPGLDGFAVCQHLRAHPGLAQVPVIMITALDDRDSRVRGFEAGADDFIAKPFDYAELRARIATVLRLNRYRLLLDQQARLAAERARFAWAVDQSSDGYLIIGPDDRLRYANARARTLLNLPVEGLPESSFIAAASSLYRLVPDDAWAGWPHDPPAESERYLVRPETNSASEFWLRADLLRPPPGGDDARVICLRDVTDQITSQREMWTFHAMVTHKLRTPLVSIIGGLGLLNDSATNLTPESIKRISHLALAGARRLQSEIEDILNYLRPPADIYGSDACLIGELPALIGSISAEMGIGEPEVQIGADLERARIAVARHSVEVVLRELLENARKFHPHHSPRVLVTVEKQAGDSVSLRVIDDGVGLSPYQATWAWRPYYQGEKSFTGQVDGMGLGLALVARIVLAVGGRYAIADRGDCRGVVVELELPLAQAPGQAC